MGAPLETIRAGVIEDKERDSEKFGAERLLLSEFAT